MDWVIVEKNFPGKRVHPEAIFQVQKRKEVIFKAECIPKERLISVSNKTSWKTEGLYKGNKNECVFNIRAISDDHEKK